MKVTNKFTDDFFLKYKEKPVNLQPYDEKMAILANKYILTIKKLLSEFRIETKIIGSVAYKIPTLDVEIGVYCGLDEYEKIIKKMTLKYGGPEQFEKEFSRFSINGEVYDFDIHVYTGYEGMVSRKLTKYMLEHPLIILEYKYLKEKYCYSKREYHKYKNKFLLKIKRQIPDEYE